MGWHLWKEDWVHGLFCPISPVVSLSFLKMWMQSTPRVTSLCYKDGARRTAVELGTAQSAPHATRGSALKCITSFHPAFAEKVQLY